MLKIFMALPLIGLIMIYLWFKNVLLNLEMIGWITAIIIVFVAIVIQVRVAYRELEEECEDNVFAMVRFSLHRTFRQYMKAIFIPVIPQIGFIKQTKRMMSRVFNEQD